MKTNNRNVRKKHILAILSYSKPHTSQEIADLCNPVSLSSIRTSLRSYCKQGLIKRKKNNDDVFIYWITERGLERLEYLLESKSLKKQIELLVREPIRF